MNSNARNIHICRAPLLAEWIFRRRFSLHAWILQGFCCEFCCGFLCGFSVLVQRDGRPQGIHRKNSHKKSWQNPRSQNESSLRRPLCRRAFLTYVKKLLGIRNIFIPRAWCLFWPLARPLLLLFSSFSAALPPSLSGTELTILSRESGDSESCDSNCAIPRSLKALIGCDSVAILNRFSPILLRFDSFFIFYFLLDNFLAMHEKRA